MIASRVSRVAAAFVLVAMSVLDACGSSTGPGASFRPSVSNSPDDFSFQASNVRNSTSTFTYTWSNSGIRASVEQTSSVISGTGTVTILDAGRTTVYTGDLTTNGIFTSGGGAIGNWTVKIVFTGFTGSPFVHVKKS